MFKRILQIGGGIILFLVLLSIFLFLFLGNGLKNYTGSSDSFMSFGGVGASDESGVRNSISYKSVEMVDRAIQAPMAEDSSAVMAVGQADKKIIKTGNLSLKVENAEQTAIDISNIAEANNGEINNLNFYESARGTKSGSMTIRVPYKNFNAAFDKIKQTGTQVISESTNAQDITAEYIDLAARLKNKQAEEQSFQAILNRWGKVEEVLAVTRELARVRGEIEQLEGQQRYYNSQTDMSTITVNLSEDEAIAPASQDWRPAQVLKASVKQLITNTQNFIDGFIIFVITVLPLLIIYILIIWLIYFIGKRVYNRYKTKKIV